MTAGEPSCIVVLVSHFSRMAYTTVPELSFLEVYLKSRAANFYNGLKAGVQWGFKRNRTLAYCHVAPPTLTSSENKITGVQTRSSNWTDPRHLIIVFPNGTGMCFVYITIVLGQPSGVSKEVSLYTTTDWVKLICQSVGGKGSIMLMTNQLQSVGGKGLIMLMTTPVSRWQRVSNVNDRPTLENSPSFTAKTLSTQKHAAWLW